MKYSKCNLKHSQQIQNKTQRTLDITEKRVRMETQI